MNKVFNKVSIEGIVEPGQLYIFDGCRDRGSYLEPIEYLFCVKENNEILLALDMEYSIVLAETCELIEFIGFRKVNRNCHEFKFLGYEKDTGKKAKRTLYLHRILPFNEYLTKMKRLFRQ